MEESGDSQSNKKVKSSDDAISSDTTKISEIEKTSAADDDTTKMLEAKETILLASANRAVSSTQLTLDYFGVPEITDVSQIDDEVLKEFKLQFSRGTNKKEAVNLGHTLTGEQVTTRPVNTTLLGGEAANTSERRIEETIDMTSITNVTSLDGVESTTSSSIVHARAFRSEETPMSFFSSPVEAWPMSIAAMRADPTPGDDPIEKIAAVRKLLTLLSDSSNEPLEETARLTGTKTILFATTRKFGSNDQSPSVLPVNQLTFGKATVYVPLNNTPGDPSILHLNQQEFLNNIQNPQHPHIYNIFIHGFNVTFSYAVKTVSIMLANGFNKDLILFSWPSFGSGEAYFRDESYVEQSEEHLISLLNDIASFDDQAKINLIFHSMGGRLGLRTLCSSEIPSLNRVFFVASDVNEQTFFFRIADLKKNVNKIHVFGSQFDEALDFSSTIHGDFRLGRFGTYNVTKYREHRDKVELKDFTDDLISGYLNHSVYFRKSKLIAQLVDRM